MSSPVVAIIQDDAEVLNMIADCLTNERYRTPSYGQGGGADEFIEQARPDAVILDIRVEHPFAGMTVLQRLRRDEATAVLHRRLPLRRGIAAHAGGASVRGRHKALPNRRSARRMWQHAAACRAEAPAIGQVIALVDANGTGIGRQTEQLECKGYRVIVCRWGNGVYDFAVREQPELRIPARLVRRLARDPLTCQIPLLMDPPTGRDFYRRVEEIVGPPPQTESATDHRTGRPNRLV